MVTGESTKDTVKTIVQGMPAVAVYPWLLTPVLFAAQAATGATRIRHSLRPLLSFEGGLLPTTRTFRAARMRMHVSRHCEPPGRRKAPPRWLAMTANGTISDPLGEEARERGLRTMRSLSSGARLRDPLASPGEPRGPRTAIRQALFESDTRSSQRQPFVPFRAFGK